MGPRGCVLPQLSAQKPMRSRDVTLPLALWICAAACAHFLFGTGGFIVAQEHDDRSELWQLSRRAGGMAAAGAGETFEVSFTESPEESEPPPTPPVLKPPTTPPEPDKSADKPKPPQKETPKPEKKKLIVEKVKEPEPSAVPPEVFQDHRIAVRQHAKPDQTDNPTAKFIADEANHVDKETRATQTSHDRDDEQPDPGASHRSADSSPGNSETSRVAESGEHKGEKNRAPGERGPDIDVQEEPKVPKTSTAQLEKPAAPAAGAPGATLPSGKPLPAQAPHAEPQPVAGGTPMASPEVDESASGTWAFNPARQGSAAGTTPPTVGGAPPLPGGKMWTIPGLGQSVPRGAVNTNLNQGEIASIVGSDNLRKLREADGERRKSEHRGSWTASNFDRWRSAIENYVSSVKEGNQTALNTAAVPFASYLNGIHNRIHPIFADSFLESLTSLPPSHPMNDQSLVTRLEIVLTRQGHLKKMGVVKTSGITAFDIAALDAVDRAQPFGPAPTAILSPDGNVYLHWEFHRDPVYACSTMNAQKFILSVPPPNTEPSTPTPSTPTPGPSRERGSPPSSPNDVRQGALPPSRERFRVRG